MQKHAFMAILVLLCLLFSTSHSQEWQMKQARIMTPWAADIDPENVLPEYPRPQMVRESWMNLNGIWDYALASRYNPNQIYDYKILVPFPMESAISGLMWRDFDNQYGGKKYAYRRFFTLPEDMNGKKILLHFGGVGWLSEVWVNGVSVGTHMGEYDPFYFDITANLKESGSQEICVIVQDYQNDSGTPTGKQKTNEKGIWYTPSTGIWQTVWIEAVSDVHITNLSITPDIDKKEINITTFASSESNQFTVELDVYDGDMLVSKTSNVSVGEVQAIPISEMKLWSPDDPFLYDFTARLYENGNLVDSVKSYFGMRKISMGTFAGKPCIMLNNEYIFQYGVLDQGYWPDGIYTAPSDEALKFDLEMTKKLGMNMTRKHIKVEPARWYYHCDRIGLLVWQDMPNSSGTKKYLGMENKQENFQRELRLMIENLKNHPSIIMWVLYNEGWGQPSDDAIIRKEVDMIRAADSTRLVNATSGWRDVEYGDMKDSHWYPNPNLFPNHLNQRAVVCGEFGGITLRIPGHQWLGGSNMSYTQVNTSEALKNRFLEYAERVKLLGSEGLCAAVYTQITDVEDEENGLITYDRKVVKVNDTQIAEIADKLKRNYTHGTIEVLPTSHENYKKSTWKYLMSNSPLSHTIWNNPDFDDSDWQSDEAPFGNDVTIVENWQNEYKISNWTSSHIYLRRIVEFSELLTLDNLESLRARVFHDEDCQVYLNGVLIAHWTGFETNYQYKLLDINQVRAAIKIGEPNLLAVYVRQTVGGQFIDIGFCLYDVEREKYMTPTSVISPVIHQYNTGLQLFPNPVKSEFSMVIQGNEPVSSVYLFDITGKLIKTFSVEEKYNIEDVGNGVYIVVAKTSSNRHTARLFVNK